MNALSLCSGIGGLELGLERAVGVRGVGFAELDTFAAAVVVARMEDARLDRAPVFESVESVPGWLYRDAVDLVAAGFPCQPFSAAGSKRGTDDERWIFPSILDQIRAIDPPLVFLENVPGITLRGGGDVLGGLADLGFDAVWDCFAAADVGAPHRRNRWFALAWRLDDLGARGISDAVGRVLRIESERGERPGGVEGADVEHSGGAGREESEPSARREDRGDRAQTTESAPESGQGLGDADGARRATTVRRREDDVLVAASRRGEGDEAGIPDWPPGPDDERWSWICERRPDLAPAVSEVPFDEPRLNPRFVEWLMGFPIGWTEIPDASRRDRLRVLGNAVVPACAALAFRVLIRRAHGLLAGPSGSALVRVSGETGQRSVRGRFLSRTDAVAGGRQELAIAGDRLQRASAGARSFVATISSSTPAAARSSPASSV